MNVPGATFPRPLSADETRILTTLLTQDFPAANTLLAQLPFVEAVGACDCGCPTVDLGVDRTAVAAAHDVTRSPIQSEAYVLGDDGEPIAGIIVFVKEGYLTMLEMYSLSELPTQWPPTDRLQLYLVT